MPTITEYFNAFLANATHAFFTGLLPVLTISTLIYVAFRFANARHQTAATAFLFALVGSLVGVLLGASRDPAVQAIVPALVTLLTGYLGWTLRKEAHEDPGKWMGMLKSARAGQGQEKGREEAGVEFITVLVFAAITGLMTATAAGTMWGASLRLSAQEDERRYEEWRLAYEKKQLPIEIELLRRKAGLDAKPAEKKAE